MKYIFLCLLIIVVLLAIELIIQWYFKAQKWTIQENFDENKNYLEGVDVIYWINLERSTDRRDNMLKMFSDKTFKDIPNIRINAVDGQKLKLEDYFAVKPTIELSNNQYACLLSHLITIKVFEKTDANIALIMEDDASLDYQKFWNRSIKEIAEKAPPDWEVIKLAMIPYNCNPDVYKHQQQEFSDSWTASTLAYLINKKGAKKISEHWINNKYDIDLNIIPVADMYIYSVLRTYDYIIPYFTYPYNNDSDLNARKGDILGDICKNSVHTALTQISGV